MGRKAWRGVARYSVVWHNRAQRGAVQRGMVRGSMVRHGVAWCSAVGEAPERVGIFGFEEAEEAPLHTPHCRVLQAHKSRQMPMRMHLHVYEHTSACTSALSTRRPAHRPRDQELAPGA